jgi:Domain of unknown function (DUF6457)
VSKPSDPMPTSVPIPAAALPTGHDWIAAFAVRLGVAAPTEDEFNTLLSLAGVAAHSSERIAAPVACWLAAKAGMSPGDGLVMAQSMTRAADGSDTDGSDTDGSAASIAPGRGPGVPGGS